MNPLIYRRFGLVALVALAACEARPTSGASSLDLQALLGAQSPAGFERALSPRTFVFPADHGPHPTFRSEWWYVTGTLRATNEPERRYGYQLTIFRQALAAQLPTRPAPASSFATRDVYMAHFAFTDLANDSFTAEERFARGDSRIAFAQAEPFQVFVDDWEIAGGSDSTWRVRVHGKVSVDLELTLSSPPVLQGDQGLSAKGAQAGNASYYYSLVHMATQGTITPLAGEPVSVTGQSWFDREWSTSALPPDVVGWDWLSLHLSDGRSLMVYRLRTHSGGTSAQSRATLIESDGRSRSVTSPAFSFEPLGLWISPRTKKRYPAGFRLRAGSLDPGLADVHIRPWRADQELDVSVAYWEGAVTAEAQGKAPGWGEGYLEMTGYTPRAF